MTGTLAVATFMIVLFGLFYLALWWKDHDPGLQWIAASCFLAGIFYGGQAAGWIQPVTYLDPPWAVSLLICAVAALSIGLFKYVDPEHWQHSPLAYLALLPVLILVAQAVLGVRISRVAGTSLFVVPYFFASLLVWRARSKAPKAGYELLALTLIAWPLGHAGVLLLSLDPTILRYLGVMERLLISFTLLVVCLHRRRVRLEQELSLRVKAERELAAANAELEAKVDERTNDLRSLVSGLESFNRNVSHDLRGPLAGIEGLAQLAAKHQAADDAPQVARMLELIEQQARKATQLVATLLDLARISHSTVERVPVDMGQLVKGVAEDLSLRQSTGLPQIVVHAMPTVEVDPMLVRAIFSNLISNACKFLAGRNDGRVEVGTEGANGHTVFFVRDNGPGFDMNTASHMFEPFQRFHGAAFAGHGLGLSIVKRAVERHGGRVWARAEPNKGAAFLFTFGTERRPGTP